MLTLEDSHGTSEPLVERRGLPRLNVSASIQFRNVLKPQEPFAGSLSKDISAGGLRVSTPTFLPKDARLVLLLTLPALLKPMRAIARVVWVVKQGFTEAYECGIQFLEIASEDKRLIADYVERGVVTPRS